MIDHSLMCVLQFLANLVKVEKAPMHETLVQKIFPVQHYTCKVEECARVYILTHTILCLTGVKEISP